MSNKKVNHYIKIYDKDYNPLTTLFIGDTDIDYNSLSYSSKVNGVGEASFTVRIDNNKITSSTIKHYNKIEIYEDDLNNIKWSGVIVSFTVSLNTVKVSCYSLLHMLEKRITADGIEIFKTGGEIATDLLNYANSEEDTGIIAGTLDCPTSADLTFTRASVLSALGTTSDSTDGQYIVGVDRKLHFRSKVGNDYSNSIIFKYDINQIELSNILKFQVDDSGTKIISRTYGKAEDLVTTQTNSDLKDEFGLLEDYQSFREQKDQSTLNQVAMTNNKDSQHNPSLELSPNVIDNFEAGDTVGLLLNNGFIALDGQIQIKEKRTTIVNGQKKIVVVTEEDPNSLITEIKAIKRNVKNLDTNVSPSVISTGDMKASTYDPSAKHVDVYAMDNMEQGGTNLFVTSAEKARWEDKMDNPMTAVGDIIYGGTNGVPAKLARGNNAQVLSLVSGIPTWTTPANGADILQMQIFS